jgi:hypothetical protein
MSGAEKYSRRVPLFGLLRASRPGDQERASPARSGSGRCRRQLEPPARATCVSGHPELAIERVQRALGSTPRLADGP